MAEVGHWFRDSPMKLHSLHSPLFSDELGGLSGPDSWINLTEPSKARRIAVVDEIKRALEIAETIPCRYLIQHLGMPGEPWSERKVDAAFTCLEQITLFAHQRGVEVLLENTPNDLSSADALTAFLDMTHLRNGLCFDVGHAHLNEGVDRAFALMKERIRSTHLHDNNRRDNGHLPPWSEGGTIDWKAAMRLLRSRPEQCPLVLELKEDPEIEHPFEAARRLFDRLESLDVTSKN